MSSPHQPDDASEHTVSLGKNTPPSNTPPSNTPPSNTPPSNTPPPQQSAYPPPQQGWGPPPSYDPGHYAQPPQDPNANPYAQPPYPGYGSYDQPYGAYPQTGYPQPYPGYGQPYPESRGTNTMAILALVFGILVAPLGLVFGFVARSQIKKTGEDGDGLALAGIIVGGIFTLLFIAYIVFIIIFFAAVASSVPGGY